MKPWTNVMKRHDMKWQIEITSNDMAWSEMKWSWNMEQIHEWMNKEINEWHEMKRNKMNWTEPNWVDMKRNEWMNDWINEMKWNEIKRNETKWNEMKINYITWHDMKWLSDCMNGWMNEMTCTAEWMSEWMKWNRQVTWMIEYLHLRIHMLPDSFTPQLLGDWVDMMIWLTWWRIHDHP